MPLKYDDIPGSWGVYSRGWPSLNFASDDDMWRAYIACSKAKIVPYGSYVLMDKQRELRVETEEMKSKLAVYLAESPHKTYAELSDHFKSIGLIAVY
jgi:hypothetical protein